MFRENFMNRRLVAVRPSKIWFLPCCITVFLAALFFIENLFVWDGGLPADKHFFGAVMGNVVGLLFLIRFEFVDYGRRNSGTYVDWKPKARIRARWVTLLGWLLGFVHTFYFVQEWSRNW